MYGFLLKRGDNIVYNLTGATAGHPFHSPTVPDWAVAMDGLEIEKVVANLKVDDDAKAALVGACQYEISRHRRSIHKAVDGECVVQLVITP